jgi:vacuolar-type H+-ATPase subunit I/STV1
MKLKELISEKVVVDTKIQSEIDELGQLTDKIEKLKKQLQPLQKRYGKVVEDIIPFIDKLDKETLTTNNFVMKIIRRGYERENYSYKEGFLNGLNKVNENTKRILQQILDETKKLTKINPSFTINPIGEGREGQLYSWYKWFKVVIKRLLKNFKGISDGNKMLKRLV